MELEDTVKELIARSRAAQKQIEFYTQEQVDRIAREFAKIVFDHAEELARMAVDETRMGVYEDKINKNKGKSRIIWNYIKDKKSVGILRELPELGITEVAKPMGVIVAVTPCTNPIVTPMCNAMYAVKCRNSIIIAPHPRAKKCTEKIEELYRDALHRLGAPEDLFISVSDPSVECSALLMNSADAILATGGMGMVRSAYSSGKPCYGVGAGNVQCIFDEDIQIEEEVPKVIAGRIFDNGIICSGEQTVIAPKKDYDRIIAEFVKNGALYLDNPEDVSKVRNALFPDGVMSRHLVGQSVEKVLELSGIKAEGTYKLIVLKADTFGKEDLLSKEKMCPVMSAYAYDTWEDAVKIAGANLAVEGAGHSVAIHSNNKAHIEYAGEILPVSRVLINQICATMNGGAFANSLSPTTTLGCGSWGNNSISENLSYYHLMNVTRIATVKPDWSQPSDDEIWGE